MARHLLVILGAGASTPYHLPLLRDLFAEASVRHFLTTNPSALSFFESTFWNGLGFDLDTASKGPNLEMMMDAIVTGAGGPTKARASADYRTQRFFLDMVAYNALGKGRTSRNKVFNPFIEWTEDFADRITVATFNWDLMYEASYYHTMSNKNPKVAFPLQDWDDSDARTTILKLHGSLSWWLKGSSIHYRQYGGWTKPTPLEVSWDTYSPTSPEIPVIVEPSGYKSDAPEMDLLKTQWEVFEAAARDASHVISLGYSWPANDRKVKEVCHPSFLASGRGIDIVDVNPYPGMKSAFPNCASRIRDVPMTAGQFLELVKNKAFHF